MEELRVKITVEHNGKEKSRGVDYSEFLNEGRDLQAEYIFNTLSYMLRGVVEQLQKEKLAIPYINP